MDRRLKQHANNTGAKYFRGRRPEKVLYLEGGHDKSTASQREAYIKSLSRQQKELLILSSANEMQG
jgi:putative endonuclease